MAVAGSLTYDTKIDKNGFEKGLNSLKNSTNTVGGQIKSIVTALGIDKLISATFNLLNNSLDGAISRLDTLNNYPKVMSNLGIASEDAQKSIDKMSNKLAGLPTTLDQGALAVQRFTSKNSDIDKSTDYFLALNNALLAGGAGADIQSSALEQLSQAYSKGKPDMMEWRTAMMAMPAQLKQVAEAMGYTDADKLGEDLRNGKVSMDSFMSSIVRLNSEGISGFQSFEEQARNSTGGIATSITVAKTQVVKGLTDIIGKIDEMFRENGIGGIGEIIANIGKKAKEALDFVADKLPSIINFIKQIAPIIVTITSAFIAFKAVLAIQGLISGVKNAFMALNMVMMMNPIALIVAAIAGLVAAFLYLWNTSEGFRNFWIDLWNNIKELVSSFIEFFSNFPYNIGFLIGKAIVFFAELPRRIKEQLINALNNTINWLSNMNQKITTAIPNMISNIKNWFAELPQNMFNIGKNIVQGLWNGIKNAGSWIKNKVKEFARGILDGMKSALGIHSPSTLFENEVGKFIPQGVAVGIEADTDEALKAIDNMNNDIISEMNRAVAFETGSINANASVKSNNSMLNVIKASFNVDGSVDMDGQKVGRIVTPHVTKNLRTAGVH